MATTPSAVRKHRCTTEPRLLINRTNRARETGAKTGPTAGKLNANLVMPGDCEVRRRTIGVARLLSGCGGGSSSNTPTNGNPVPSIEGQVIDGDITGAMVCLDMDRSFTCDPGEPSTISSNDGRHQLNISQISAGMFSASQMLTYVPGTALDSDDAGKSLEESGRLPFYMAAPVTMHNVGANGTVSTGAITPFSTLVAAQVLYKGMTLFV